MNYLKPILLIIFLVYQFVGSFVWSQNSKITYRNDLDNYWSLVSNYHPDIQLDKVEFVKDSLRETITSTTNILDFYRILSLLNSRVNCVHTKVTLSQLTIDSLKKETIYLPYYFTVYEDSIFVLIKNNYYNVLAIDGRNSKIIIDSLKQYLASDNGNIGYKIQLINNYFPVLYSLLLSDTNSHSISLKDSIITIHSVDGFHIDSNYQNINNNLKNSFEYQFFDMDSIAYLNANTFDIKYLKSKKVNYKKNIRKFFIKIEKHNIQRVIIDLRYNSGGNAKVPMYLLEYLSLKPFIFYEKVEYKKNDYRPYVKLSNTSFKKDGNYFIRKKVFNHQQLENPRMNNFKYSVYVLINNANISMAAAFVEKLICVNPNIVLIGKPIGGDFNFNAGLYITKELDFSKIKIKIPIEKITVDSTQNNYLIDPDLQLKDSQFTDKNREIIFPSLINLIKQYNLWNGKQ